MPISWKIAAGLALALGLAGVARAQDGSGASCPQACPPKPHIEVCVPDCQVPPIAKPAYAPVCDTCCPVDPLAVKKAQARAAHEAHELAEACRKEHKVEADAQQDVNQRIDRENQKIAKANARFEKERADEERELSEAATLKAQSDAYRQTIETR